MAPTRKLKLDRKEEEDKDYTMQRYLAASNSNVIEHHDDSDVEGEPNGTAAAASAVAWEDLVPRLSQDLRSGSTKTRVSAVTFLQSERPNQKERMDILRLLASNVLKYNDKHTTNHALDALAIQIKPRDGDEKPGAIAQAAANWATTETEKMFKGNSNGATTAASTRSVLLNWANTILRATAEPAALPNWSALVHAQAQLFASLQSPGVRQPFQHSAVVVTRRTVRENAEAIPHWLKALVAQPHHPVHAPLLGLVIGVALRLRAKDFAPGKSRHGEGKTMVQAVKSDILAFYTSGLLSAKTATPELYHEALDEFVSVFLTADDYPAVTSQMDKMCLRSPEMILPAMCHFYASISDTEALSKSFSTSLDNSIQNLSKSTNAAVRSGAAQLYSILLSRSNAETSVSAVKSLCDALKAGKSVSADQRACRAVMLASVAPNSDTSGAIVDALVALLPKEQNEAALKAIMSTFALHAPPVLASASADLAKVLAKGMTEAKPQIRKPIILGVGEALWKADAVSDAFQDALLPALETNLKNASTTPLTNTAGPLEGYVAAALLHATLKTEAAQAVIEKNTVAQGLLQTGVKPSFMLWDKVYRKLETESEQVWLARAVQATLLHNSEKIRASPDLHSGELFLPIAFGAVASSTYPGRLEAVQTTANLIKSQPKLALLLVPSAIQIVIERQSSQAGQQAPSDDDKRPDVNAHARYQALLQAVAVASADADAADKSQMALQLALTAHHSLVDPKGDLFWIKLVQSANVSPELLVGEHQEELLRTALDTLRASTETDDFGKAARQLLTSLIVVSPMSIVPELSEQASVALRNPSISSVGPTEVAIYSHPHDQPYVNVLGNKNADLPTKGKGAADKKWDDEVRKSLAAKQKTAAAPALSKADQAAVKAQLAKEAETRADVGNALALVKQALSIVESLLASRSEVVEEEMPTLVESLGAFVSQQLARLVPAELFAVWLGLTSLCFPEETQLTTALANVTLEAHRALIIPDDSVASMGAMATRVLYRLKFICDLKTLSGHAFSFVAPLVFYVLSSSGMGLPADDKESSTEQMTLAIDILAAHCHAASDLLFPRLRMADSIISTLLRHPQLTRQATTALITLGEAISDSATQEELNRILRGTLAQESHIRLACLQALQHADLTELSTSPELWLLKQDADERNAKLSDGLWAENGLDMPEEFITLLLPFLEDERQFVREACAESFAPALEEYPGQSGALVQALTKLYHEKNKILKPEYDSYGMVIEETLNREDPWRSRVAIAKSFKSVAECLGSQDVLTAFDLLLSGGALGDRSGAVRSEMLSSASRIIEAQGRRDMSSLIDIFDSHLGRPESAFGDQFTADRIKEAMVILYGSLARHMEATDPRVTTTIERLLDALRTPSEVVQIAVSDCLPPLVKLRKEEAPLLIDRLMTQLFAAQKYAERRGAAYGLAGAIKGRGISALKEFDIVTRLKDSLEDKKNTNARQGALFAVETLSMTLGRIFEPYIIQILPFLLLAMGDGTVEVREATQDASRAIMGKVSGHAVKLILPSLLGGLEDRQWRSKKGAIEMLGAMANLAPRQLAISLPSIIPRLAEVLTDTHSQVRAAGNASLKRFGEVITNPEIQQIQNVILDALVDPAGKTAKALDSLISTSFAHFIDSSSLALVVPILDRGLRERSSEIKRKAAQIVGNMATLTDARDLSPYLGQLTPLVRSVLVDPVPEARATAAKALGGLVERLGEDAFPDLISALLEVLRSENSGIDQQGAAQGLAEILGGLGVERLEELFPDILDSTSSPRAHIREGFMSLLVFLPSTFGDRFTPYLNRIISPVLSGLADASDFVRDASMRAGRMIVTSHSQKAVDLLLPELEQGLFDSAWRIRQSSLQLIGELLFRLVGITARTDNMDEEEKEDEDEDRQTGETSKKALVEVLGQEKRDKVLASIYIIRQDSSGLVRQLSVHIWKALVHNTPRMVKEILPTLIQLLVKTLSSPGFEQRETASRTLGELCRRLGDNVLDSVLPILRDASAGNTKTREGVCRAYIEIMRNSDEEQLEGHEAAIASAIRVLLVDDDVQVRNAAAKAFDAMQQTMGARAIDETVPTLLDSLSQGGGVADAALSALREIMAVRAAVVVPVLIPTLTKVPVSTKNANALSHLVGAAGPAISSRVVTILTALVATKEKGPDEETAQAVDQALEALFASIQDIVGLNSTMMHLLSMSKEPSVEKRVNACNLFATFCQNATVDHTDFDVDFLRQLVSMLDDGNDVVVQASWQALTALLATLSKDDMEALAVPLRRTVENTDASRKVPGFCLPNGIKPLLPIFLQGLLAGTAEQREQSAYGLGELVERTTPESIKPFVAQITGPLIRILGERVPAPVKTAILTSLTTLLKEIPANVRPFYPQIQRTFVKNLSDATSAAVRTRAGNGLAALMAHQPRVDPLITELITGATQSEESELRDSFAATLPKVITSGGKNISPPIRTSVVSFLQDSYGTSGQKESWLVATANTLASLGKIDAAMVGPLLQSEVLNGPLTAQTSITLRALAEAAPEVIETLGVQSDFNSRVMACIGVADSPSVSRPAREARDILKL